MFKRIMIASALITLCGTTIATETSQSAKSTLANSITVTSKLNVSELQKFSLGKQIDGLTGYDIRARHIVVPPGGTIAEHEHSTRPGIVYVLTGEIIEYRGNQSKRLKPGDSIVEDAGTVHAYKNDGQVECLLIAFDIPKR
jgi:quercetin dioxygenase-like cupin family protein